MIDVLLCIGLSACVLLLSANSIQLWTGRRRVHKRLQFLEESHAHEVNRQRRFVELSRLNTAKQLEVRWLKYAANGLATPSQLFNLLADATHHGPPPRIWLLDFTGEILDQNSHAEKLNTPLMVTAAGLRRMSVEGTVLFRSQGDFLFPSGPISDEITDLHVFHCSSDNSPRSCLLLSHLPSLTGDVDADRGLLATLARHLRNPQSGIGSPLQMNSTDELDLIRDMLSLRTIADCEFETPIVLLQTFLVRLALLTNFERASVYHQVRPECDEWELLATGGVSVPPDEYREWNQLEKQLHVVPLEQRLKPVWLRPEPTPTGRAPFHLSDCLIVTDQSGHGTAKAIVLTSRSSVVRSQIKIELAKWSAQFLPQAFKRAMDRLQIEERARRDGLTRVANRQTFDVELQKLLKYTSSLDQHCGLLLIDIDHFKQVNDQYGHQAGDLALQAVATIISQTVQGLRITDRGLVARYGGEEFAVILPGVTLAGARRIAEQIRCAIAAREHCLNRHTMTLTASIGVASLAAGNTTPAQLIEDADQSLYLAKREGRNCIRSSESPRTKTSRHSQMAGQADD